MTQLLQFGTFKSFFSSLLATGPAGRSLFGEGAGSLLRVVGLFASAQELADIRRPYLLHCIAACGYGVLWNAYKRVAEDFSPDEKAAMFHDNAARFYRIAPV